MLKVFYYPYWFRTWILVVWFCICSGIWTVDIGVDNPLCLRIKDRYEAREVWLLNENCSYSLLFGIFVEVEGWFEIDIALSMICAGFLSKFGAGLFLLVQVIILLEFVHSWNDAWVEKDEQKWCAKKTFMWFNFSWRITVCDWDLDIFAHIGMLLCLLYQSDAT